MNINPDAFSHGQVLSKIWLCEQLEPYLPSNAQVAIVGSWHNVLAFTMLVRNQSVYKEIVGIDLNAESVSIANIICNAWCFNNKVRNLVDNANTHDYTKYNTVINCSVEHMNNTWFSGVSTGSLVCIQSSDVLEPKYPWLITNPNPDQETLVKKYPLSQTLFSGEKEFDYGSWGYKRFMLIGIK